MPTRLVVVLLAALLLLAGCIRVQGTPMPGEAGPLRGRAVFGDLNTVDYCSLFQPAPLRAINARTGPAESSFLTCTVDVATASGPVVLTIGYLDDAEHSQFAGNVNEVRALPRELSVRSYDTYEPGWCFKYLLFSDGVNLEVAARGEGQARETLCLVAGAAVDGVRQNIVTGKVEWLTFRQNSLGRTDACSLARADEVAAIVGAAAAPWQPLIGHWCQWGGAQADAPSVKIEYALHDVRTPGSPAYDDAIGGRQARVVPLAAGYCAVESPHIAFTENDPYAIEIISVYAYLPGVPDACPVARRLAELIWPRLPPTPR
ncbi:hypothetical protein ABZ863_05725 [Saccharomonospora sp. NPDC046836]|uniref:hypothetical protein n=1 Tax=Saccharomonospora sp. NPDC046836 TaxID=3156921 RepID=UPI0033DC00C7